MRTVGGLLLFLSISMIVLVGTIAIDGLTEEAANNTSTFHAAEQSAGITKPVLIIVGFCALIVGVMLAINAFR